MAFTVKEVTTGAGAEEAFRVMARNASDPQRMPARVAWRYDANPSPSRLFALLDASGKTVGAVGVVYREFSTREGSERLGLCADFYIDKDRRSLGPALVLQKQLLERGVGESECLYGFPNERALAVMKRAGFHLLGASPSFVRPVRPSYFLRRRVPGLPRFIGRLIDRAFRLADTLSTLVLDAGYRIEELTEFDARFDDLWIRCSRMGERLGRRDAATLTWRLQRHPHRSFRIFGLFRSRSSLLLGYAAIEEQEPGRWFVFDLLVDSGQASISRLIRRLAQRAGKEGVRSLNLQFLGSRRFNKAIRRAGFIAHEESKRYTAVGRACPDAAARSLLDLESWYLTRADEDV